MLSQVKMLLDSINNYGIHTAGPRHSRRPRGNVGSSSSISYVFARSLVTAKAPARMQL